MSQDTSSAQPGAAGAPRPAPTPAPTPDIALANASASAEEPSSGQPDSADHSLRIHTCARELLAWLLPALGRFPREQRHTVQQHMADLAMRALDQLISARHLPGGLCAQALREADMALDHLRQDARVALLHEW